MQGQMQQQPLLISSLVRHAREHHPEQEIVTRAVEGGIHRTTFAETIDRAGGVARLLEGLGIGFGDRVATLAWNTWRHLELYYAVSGIGAVLHTVNPRLFPEQIAYILNHSGAKVLCVDLTFLPLVDAVRDKLDHLETVVVLTDEAHMSDSHAGCYETLLAQAGPGEYDWPTFDENTASSLCYTSGTTGNPKGVLYSHRSTVLHSFAVCAADGLGLSSNDAVLPVVPMFHVNAWGIPYAAAMCGAKLVFPGAALDGASLWELLDQERVTISAGVPTVWLGLLQYLQAEGKGLPHMNRTVIGGSAAPEAMIRTFEQDYDVRVLHAWGMTEMSPLGTVGVLKRDIAEKPFEERLPWQLKQGKAVYGVEMRIVDDEGNELPRDGEAFGHLQVRGPWVLSGYFRGEGGDVVDADGWFDTGDVATIDARGYMQITDRAKDVIKSGGEWISSIELENIAVGHPDVAEAAVIGVAHPKWDERPLLVVIAAEGRTVDTDALLESFEGKVAKWWIPDDVVVVDEIPHTATGKIQKRTLREQFAEHYMTRAMRPR